LFLGIRFFFFFITVKKALMRDAFPLLAAVPFGNCIRLPRNRLADERRPEHLAGHTTGCGWKARW